MHEWHSDIATTLVAFRDRLNLFTRDLDNSGPPAVNFREWWDVSVDPAVRLDVSAKSGAPGIDRADTARWGATADAALREEPGFRSLGELALLRDYGYEPTASDPAYPHDIDRIGFDDQSVSIQGVDSLHYDVDEDNIPDADDGIEDDFDERLAIASAVMNSASIRSDIFAVWFIIHGYQESDTTGLTDEDPLIPTIARRFVMVVDRSNVTQPGEKPKIVLFKEVPL
jgi:hypothetical protein